MHILAADSAAPLENNRENLDHLGIRSLALTSGGSWVRSGIRSY